VGLLPTKEKPEDTDVRSISEHQRMRQSHLIGDVKAPQMTLDANLSGLYSDTAPQRLVSKFIAIYDFPPQAQVFSA
jgi:hypothetical protein